MCFLEIDRISKICSNTTHLAGGISNHSGCTVLESSWVARSYKEVGKPGGRISLRSGQVFVAEMEVQLGMPTSHVRVQGTGTKF